MLTCLTKGRWLLRTKEGGSSPFGLMTCRFKKKKSKKIRHTQFDKATRKVPKQFRKHEYTPLDFYHGILDDSEDVNFSELDVSKEFIKEYKIMADDLVREQTFVKPIRTEAEKAEITRIWKTYSINSTRRHNQMEKKSALQSRMANEALSVLPDRLREAAMEIDEETPNHDLPTTQTHTMPIEGFDFEKMKSRFEAKYHEVMKMEDLGGPRSSTDEQEEGDGEEKEEEEDDAKVD